MTSMGQAPTINRITQLRIFIMEERMGKDQTIEAKEIDYRREKDVIEVHSRI